MLLPEALLPSDDLTVAVTPPGFDGVNTPFCQRRSKVRPRVHHTLTWLKKCPDARAEVAKERERLRIGRIARRKATAEIIV